ncbi:uncharacterized protein LOC108622961 [Ceratina calcarata]|uniref:Uncharacterized protein LOC108622961 n=1 Tax=Ceratina calcarata TaxID=156304 RepID=A0AAJ7W9S5_9HYME|nr:uncharacterized protein LOC108622961 [Ceratina calcarata]
MPKFPAPGSSIVRGSTQPLSNGIRILDAPSGSLWTFTSAPYARTALIVGFELTDLSLIVPLRAISSRVLSQTRHRVSVEMHNYIEFYGISCVKINVNRCSEMGYYNKYIILCKVSFCSYSTSTSSLSFVHRRSLFWFDVYREQ